MAATQQETLAEEAAAPEQTLAEEARRRPKAGAAAIAAGVLTLAGALTILAEGRDFPTASLVDALDATFGADRRAGPGIVARKVLYLDEHLVLTIASRLVPAIAAALAAVAMVFLYLSTKARNPQVGRAALVVAVSGGVLTVVAAVAGTISLAVDVTAFADSAARSEQAARDVLGSPFTQGALQLTALGTSIVGLAIVLTALNAMRVGLLTRFMGVLGIIVGVLFILPLDGTLPFVKIFWLVALGVLLLGRWPGGVPPAWVTGEAQPWPTQQEIREQRLAQQAARGAAELEPSERRPRRGRAEPPETPAPEPPRSRPHSSSKKKKKRKRR
ncbi:MAG TPA: hypothetical protein VG474_15535 [Solirubrobacteraceae bacterium]|nr:hypothetical protein [Solirubrobacteraceae bacterium]